MRARKFFKILSDQLTMELLKIMPRLGTSFSFAGPGTLPTWKFLPQNTIKCPFRVYSGELPNLQRKRNFGVIFVNFCQFSQGGAFIFPNFLGFCFWPGPVTGKNRHDGIFTAKRA